MKAGKGDRQLSKRARLRRWGVILAGCLSLLGISAPVASAAVEWKSETFPAPTYFAPGGTATLVINPGNTGSTASSGAPTLAVQLPEGITASGSGFLPDGYFCSGTSTVTCFGFSPVSAFSRGTTLKLPLAIGSSVSGSASATVAVSGGGAVSPSIETVGLTFSAEPFGFGIVPGSLFAAARKADGTDFIAAGGHPYDAVAKFKLGIGTPSAPFSPPNQSGGHIKDIVAELPPGFVGDPTAAPQCPQSTFYRDGGEVNSSSFCPVDTQVGILFIFSPQFPTIQTSGVWNLQPNAGEPALFGFFTPAGKQTAIPSVRSDGNYGITLAAKNITEAGVIYRSELVVWGNPSDPSHDVQRCVAPNPVVEPLACVGVNAFGQSEGELTGLRLEPNSSSAPEKAFLSNPTNCSAGLNTSVHLDKWHDPAPEGQFDDPRWANDTFHHPDPLVGCEDIPFTPSIGLQPTTKKADSPTGLDVHIHFPREDDDDPEGLVQAHLKKVTVVLPDGVGFNSGIADGLAACTPAQIGMTSAVGAEPIRFDNVEPNCPDASKIGTGEVITPLLENHLRGEVFLASQKANPFGSNYAIYVVVREPSILIKVAGKVEPDPVTGQIKVTFDQNPQLPFEDFFMHFYDGPRAALATPVTCGTFSSKTEFVPWSAADPEHPTSEEVVTTNDPFSIDSSPGGACVSNKAQLPLNVGLNAGSKDPIAAAHTPFSIQVTRPDGNQELDRLEISPPPGFIASLRGIPYCSDAQIAAAASRSSGKAEQQSPSCPVASQVGTTNVGAGAGSSPFYAPGKLYLAGPYKGENLSVVVVTPAVAGPFDLGNVVVRSALKINPLNARITAVTDQLPRMIEGVPLRIKDIRIALDRPDWATNPTNCEAMSVDVTAFGADGAISKPSNRYQVGGCDKLGFKPKLQIHLKGGTKRGDHPALLATLSTRQGDANIARAAVTLPPSAFLDQSHIRTICTRVQFAADACPKAAIYGFGKATTPLLDDPIEGNVYLRSSDNKLPDLVAALKGVAEIEAVGRIDSVKGGIRNSFDVVPDAPFYAFTLRMRGGNKGLVVNSQNLCAKAHRATVKLTAQNGKRYNYRPKVIADGCAKAKKGKKHKRHGSGGNS